ncbi:hypothetical protein DB30_07730 [Enhygromyxa salina]|uniref:Uncharacterized protein n=1 Tax=Enhygromyxa salina TaxID=215803 RepID=A0A0C2DBC9_9BACT|nr:hypothetical protein DB30_07730 [Enhygromyxa salina]
MLARCLAFAHHDDRASGTRRGHPGRGLPADQTAPVLAASRLRTGAPASGPVRAR